MCAIVVQHFLQLGLIHQLGVLGEVRTSPCKILMLTVKVMITLAALTVVVTSLFGLLILVA